MSEEKMKLMDRVEEEAAELLDKFKEHPIRSLVYAVFVMWALKQLRGMWK